MELSDSFPRDAKGVQGFDVDMVDDVTMSVQACQYPSICVGSMY